MATRPYMRARSGVVTALVPPETGPDAASLMLAFDWGKGYGGVSAFSETASAQSGDLNQIILLAVLFPVAVTLLIYKDQIFGGKDNY